jgi:hypothetical protein
MPYDRLVGFTRSRSAEHRPDLERTAQRTKLKHGVGNPLDAQDMLDRGPVGIRDFLEDGSLVDVLFVGCQPAGRTASGRTRIASLPAGDPLPPISRPASPTSPSPEPMDAAS